MSASGPGCVKTRKLDLATEGPFRFRRYERTLYLAVSIGRSELRKQFCALQVLASFHTAWVKSGSQVGLAARPLYPPKADLGRCAGHVRFVPVSDMEAG